MTGTAERTLPPSEAKIEQLRLRGVVPTSSTAIRLASGAAALFSLLILSDLSAFRRYMVSITLLDTGGKQPLGEYLWTSAQLALLPSAASVLVGVLTALIISRFYFRVSLYVRYTNPFLRRSLRTLVMGISTIPVTILIVGKMPLLFSELNGTRLVDAIDYFIRSAGMIWVTLALCLSLVAGYGSRLLFRREHAMTKEEVARELRG